MIIILLTFGCAKKGDPGPQGEQGTIGIPGKDGSTLLSGKINPSPSAGKEGDFYLNLITGELYGPKTANGWGIPYTMKGDKGEKGEAGSSILSGNTVPTTTVGKIGDYYIETTNTTLYGPKSNSGWGDPVSLDKNENLGVSLYFIQPDFSASYNFSATDSTFYGITKYYKIPDEGQRLYEYYWATTGRGPTPDYLWINWTQFGINDRKNTVDYNLITILHNVGFNGFRESEGFQFRIHGKGYTYIAPDFSKPSGYLVFMIKATNIKSIKNVSKIHHNAYRFMRLNSKQK